MRPAASLASRARALIEPTDPRYPGTAWTEVVALFDLGRTMEAEAVLGEGIASARALGDEAMEWRLRVEQLDIRFWLGPETESEHSRDARRAVEVFERLEDTRGLARGYRFLGDALHFERRYEEAVLAFEEGRRLALASGDEREASQRPSFGVVMGPMPVRSCLEIVESSMRSAPRPNPDGMGHLALLYAMDARPEEARDMADRAVTRARELGEWRAAPVEMYASLAYLILDDPESAEAVVRPAVEALMAMGERNLLPSAAALLGEARFRLEDLDEAMAMSLRSEGSSAAGDQIAEMEWRQLRAKVLAARGAHEEAESLAREATGIALEGFRDAALVAGNAFLDLSFVLETAGRLPEAADAADEALVRYESKGDRTSASRAMAARERLRLQAGRSSASEG
jgi:tetratricopeptide (TPR) repeat protein